MSAARDAILDAVLGVVAGDGLRGARMEDVAAAAGVSRQLVYYHFGSREGLLAALQERGLSALAAHVREAAATRPPEDFPVVVLEFLADNEALVRLLVTQMWGLSASDGGPATSAERLEEQLIAPAAAWVQAGDGGPAADAAATVARALLGQTFALALDPLTRGERLDLPTLTTDLRLFARAVLDAFRTASLAGRR